MEALSKMHRERCLKVLGLSKWRRVYRRREKEAHKRSAAERFRRAQYACFGTFLRSDFHHRALRPALRAWVEFVKSQKRIAALWQKANQHSVVLVQRHAWQSWKDAVAYRRHLLVRDKVRMRLPIP
jgi:serine/threonine protein kinase HipA of HipAB toxin-antitoxin module